MNTLKRRRLLEMIGGSVLLAGCGSGTGALQTMPSATTRDARAQISKSARKSVAFPARRPDGSLPPATDRDYRPAKRLDASSGRTTRFQRICTPDQDCSPQTGGGGGTPPDDVLSIEDASAYGWETANYTEVWDSLGSSLDAQIYYSLSGTVLTCRIVAASGTEATVSIDMASVTSQGTTYLSDGSRITIDGAGGTYNVVTADGTNISGAFVPSTGYQTLSVTRSIGGQRSAGPVTGHKQGGGGGPPGRPGSNCLQTATQAAAMLAAVTAVAMAMVEQACSMGSSVQCAAAIIVASAIISEAQELYKQIVRNACT